MRADVDIEGADALGELLATLPYKPARRALRAGLNAGATPIQKAAKRNAPTDTKLLKKAIGKKAVTRRDGTVLVLIGARVGSKFEGVDRRGRPRKPVRYDHLVEFGHAMPGGGRVAPRSFLRPAYDGARSEAMKIVASKTGERVEAEAAKLAARRG